MPLPVKYFNNSQISFSRTFFFLPQRHRAFFATPSAALDVLSPRLFLLPSASLQPAPFAFHQLACENFFHPFFYIGFRVRPPYPSLRTLSSNIEDPSGARWLPPRGDPSPFHTRFCASPVIESGVLFPSMIKSVFANYVDHEIGEIREVLLPNDFPPFAPFKGNMLLGCPMPLCPKCQELVSHQIGPFFFREFLRCIEEFLFVRYFSLSPC